MSSSITPQPQSETPGNAAKTVPVEVVAPALTFEESVQLAWAKHRNSILIACGVIVVGILGVGLTKQYLESRETEIGVAFGAADTSEKLRAFANEHSGHQLAGIAWLKIADEAYSAGRYSDAATGYAKASEQISQLPFAGRAALAQAMSQIAAGDKAKGEAALKLIAGDAKQLKALRAEARYNLAVLARDAGRIDEARKLCTEVSGTDDFGSFWTQRALYLQMSLGEAPVAAKS